MTAALPEWHDALHKTRSEPSSVKNILLLLDKQGSWRRASAIARHLTTIYSATLHLLCAEEGLASPREAAERLGLGQDDLHGAVLDCREGGSAKVILDAIQQTELPMLVMCANPGETEGADCFGEVMDTVLAGTPARVVLVGPECEQGKFQLRRVLLAHDGTASSDQATAPAAELAQRSGAEVIALHVAAGGERYRKQPRSLPSPQYVDQPQHEWPSWANEFLNRMQAIGAPLSSVSFKLVVTGGQPGSEVAEVSRERKADLVVMAWHGKWDAPHSPSKVVLRNAGCPVLLIYSAAG